MDPHAERNARGCGRVHFDLSKIEIHDICMRSELSSEEFESLWLMQKDYHRINSWVRITIKMMRQGLPEEAHADDYCYRGLETRMESRRDRRQYNITTSIYAVLNEQSRLRKMRDARYSKDRQAELLAEVYQGYSVSCGLDAYTVAKSDAQVVRDEIQKSMEDDGSEDKTKRRKSGSFEAEDVGSRQLDDESHAARQKAREMERERRREQRRKERQRQKQREQRPPLKGSPKNSPRYSPKNAPKQQRDTPNPPKRSMHSPVPDYYARKSSLRHLLDKSTHSISLTFSLPKKTSSFGKKSKKDIKTGSDDNLDKGQTLKRSTSRRVGEIKTGSGDNLEKGPTLKRSNSSRRGIMKVLSRTTSSTRTPATGASERRLSF